MAAQPKFNTGEIIALSVMGLIVIYVGYKIFFPSVKAPKNTDAIAAAQQQAQYTPETFPLAMGMRGEDIRQVRAVLGLTPTDIFDQDLQDALQSKFGVTTISESDFDYYKNFITANV